MIEEHKPTHIIIVDAADFRKRPGEVRVMAAKEILDAHISTHTLPLTILVDYFERSFNPKTLIIGIQPKNLDFGTELTPEVREAANRVAQDIYEAIRGN